MINICNLSIYDEYFQTVYKNLNPVFNYFEDFFVRNIIESDVSLEVMDYDTTSGNDEIGRVRFNLRDVAPKVGFSLKLSFR